MTMPVRSISTKNLYERDFYQWIETTAKLLKERHFDAVDWDNLIEEIESMGRSERKEIKSRLITLMEHLLKLIYWEAEKDYNARSWRNTIIEQRNQMKLSLEDSPSLRNLLPEVFLDCYQDARELVLRKSDLPTETIPTEPTFTLEDVLNPDYLPE